VKEVVGVFLPVEEKQITFTQELRIVEVYRASVSEKGFERSAERCAPRGYSLLK
jgi:hypothetical protein